MMLQTKILLMTALIHTSGLALASSQSEDSERFGTYFIRCITQPSPQIWRRENLELFLKTSPDEGHLAAALKLNPSSKLERYIKLLITDRSKFPTDNEKKFYFGTIITAIHLKYQSSTVRHFGRHCLNLTSLKKNLTQTFGQTL